MEVLREAPKVSTFVPLAEHQSTTPASFYTGPPVLHYHSSQSKLIVSSPEIEKALAFEPLLKHAQPIESGTAHGQSETNGNAEEDEHAQSDTQQVVDKVEIFVTSDKLLLFSSAAAAGVAIPYPTISLHAIQTLAMPSDSSDQGQGQGQAQAQTQAQTHSPGQGVYMQLITSTDDEEEVDSISITLVPTAATAQPSVSRSAAAEDSDLATQDQNDAAQESPAQALFNALSDCSNLHPDPVNEEEDDDDDGAGVSRLLQSGLAIPLGGSGSALPPPMPGSGGWITAENMHEFIDEDGNFIEHDEEEVDEPDSGKADAEEADAAPLGPGAGTVRPREEGVSGAGEDEPKWQRTG